MACQFLIFGIGFINKINFLGGFNINSDFFIYQGSFIGYVAYSINFLIPSILLMLMSVLNGNKKIYRLIFYLVITTGIFLTYAFRYRLILLLISIFLIYFFYKKTKPKIIFYQVLFYQVFILGYSIVTPMEED